MAPKAKNALFSSTNQPARNGGKSKQKVKQENTEPKIKKKPDRPFDGEVKKKVSDDRRHWLPQWNALSLEEKEKFPDWKALQTFKHSGGRKDGSSGQRNASNMQYKKVLCENMELKKRLAELAKERAKSARLIHVFAIGNSLYDAAFEKGGLEPRQCSDDLETFLLDRRRDQWFTAARKGVTYPNGRPISEPPEWSKNHVLDPDEIENGQIYEEAAGQFDWKWQLNKIETDLKEKGQKIRKSAESSAPGSAKKRKRSKTTVVEAEPQEPDHDEFNKWFANVGKAPSPSTIGAACASEEYETAAAATSAGSTSTTGTSSTVATAESGNGSSEYAPTVVDSDCAPTEIDADE